MEINPDALRTIRERSGLTVTALAEMAGTKQAHLSNIEAGRRQASPALIGALAEALRAPLTSIIKVPPSSKVA